MLGRMGTAERGAEILCRTRTSVLRDSGGSSARPTIGGAARSRDFRAFAWTPGELNRRLLSEAEQPGVASAVTSGERREGPSAQLSTGTFVQGWTGIDKRHYPALGRVRGATGAASSCGAPVPPQERPLLERSESGSFLSLPLRPSPSARGRIALVSSSVSPLRGRWRSNCTKRRLPSSHRKASPERAETFDRIVADSSSSQAATLHCLPGSSNMKRKKDGFSRKTPRGWLRRAARSSSCSSGFAISSIGRSIVMVYSRCGGTSCRKVILGSGSLKPAAALDSLSSQLICKSSRI